MLSENIEDANDSPTELLENQIVKSFVCFTNVWDEHNLHFGSKLHIRR